MEELLIPQKDAQRLMEAPSGDVCLLYLCLRSGIGIDRASEALRIPQERISAAAMELKERGLWTEPSRPVARQGERPNYSGADVQKAINTDALFPALCTEVQQILKKPLTQEEMKIILGFRNYLGLPPEIITILLHYCKDMVGKNMTPSLFLVEREAYRWAECGINTMEKASAFIAEENKIRYAIKQLKEVLQIYSRPLSKPEEAYLRSWIDMGFDASAIEQAYGITCEHCGQLQWKYLNSILTRWHDAGLHTADEVKAGSQNADYRKNGRRDLDEDEIAAIKRMMRE